ncbi:MAG TPA: hypothetical protein VH416_06535 [Gaiellaceae bacterium]|jgi:hypothetical protein
MARFHLLPGRRSRAEAPAPDAAPPPQRRPLPPPSRLRKERRALLQAREERLRDLGGLMLEMYRRDQFRQDLLVDRCSDLLALEERVAEIDTLLAAALSIRRRPAAVCECGTPIMWGSRFCSSCGKEFGAASMS